MLSFMEIQELQHIIYKLEADGYDISNIKAILENERTRVSTEDYDKLISYFKVTPNIQIGVSKINYGFKNLVAHLAVYLEHQDDVFGIEDKPENFEKVLKAAILNCLKNIKTEYQKEARKLIPTTPIKTATSEYPLILDFISTDNILFVTEGNIDTKYMWRIVDIKDAMGISVLDTGVTIPVTSESPLQVELTNDESTTILTVTSGTLTDTNCRDDAVWILGGK